MYRVAYEEGQRALDDQVDELNGARTRAVSYLAFVGTATAFLAGTSLRSVDRNWVFFLVAGSATALLVFMLLAALRVLVPKESWQYRISGKTLIEGWIEADVPEVNEAHLLRELTMRYDRMRANNSEIIRKLRQAYIFEIGAGTFQLILWLVLAWIFG